MASSTRSDSPFDVDFSVIRTSIDMGHKMIDQILNGIHYGSEEVRNLLYDECDFIMECKVCRNLFRSFPNFVAHKRVYCQDTNEEKMVQENTIPVRTEDEAIIVEPEPPEERPQTVVVQNNVIQKVIENKFEGKSKDYQFYTKVAENLELGKIAKVTNTVTMTAIPSNSNAVVVSHAKGDHSAKSTSKSKSPQSNVSNADGVRGRSTSPMVIDISPPKPKSVSDICKKLATEHRVELRATGLAKQIVSRQSRRTRKSVPRKSTEEVVGFNPKNASSSEPSSEAKNHKQEERPGTNTVVNDINKKAENITTTVTESEKCSDSYSDENWEKYCDFKNIKCRKCGLLYDTLPRLKIHLRSHGLKVGEYKCPKCPKFMTSCYIVTRHMKINHRSSDGEVKKYLKNVQTDNSTAKPCTSNKGDHTNTSPQEKRSLDKPAARVQSSDRSFNSGSTATNMPAQTRLSREPLLRQNEAIPSKMEVSLSLKGSKTVFKGLKNVEAVKSSERPSTRALNVKLMEVVEDNIGNVSVEGDDNETKKVERRQTRNSINSQKQVDQGSYATINDIHSESDNTVCSTKAETKHDEVKVISERSKSSHKNEDQLDDVRMIELRRRGDSTDRSKETDKGSDRTIESQQCSKLPSIRLTPVSSPIKSLPISAPTSPTTSITSNSNDGYSSKFKMTVQEMAQLVESASLSKFAKERKKRAHILLTKSKSTVKRTIPTRLSMPMKRTVRRPLLPMKASYSTRLSTDSSKGDILPRRSLNHSKRLQRELKKLANSAGLVESNIYSSSSPLLSKDSIKKANESDESASESKKVWRERKQILSPADVRVKLGTTDGQTSSRESSRDRRDRAGGRNSSNERNVATDSKLITKYDLGDKSEDKSASRNATLEKGKGQDGGIIERQSRDRNIKSQNGDKTWLRWQDRSTPRSRTDNWTIASPESEETKGQLRRHSENMGEHSVEKASVEDIEKKLISEKEEMNRRQLQITRANALRKKKLLAAQRSISNSKRIISRSTPMKSEAFSLNRLDRKSEVLSLSRLDRKANKGNDQMGDVHSHRTRLATGSIFFNSDLLKLSPSKLLDMENSPKKPETKESPVCRKLTLSSSKGVKKHVRTRSEPRLFSLSTGVKSCDVCKKVFWKLSSFKKHKCPAKLKKKRMASSSPQKFGSPEGIESARTGSEVKKQRLEMPSGKASQGSSYVSSSNKETVNLGPKSDKKIDAQDKDAGRDSPQKKAQVESSSDNTINNMNRAQQPSTSKDDTIAMDEDNSDNESEFSGFSESDLLEIGPSEDWEESDSEYIDLNSDEVDYIKDTLDKQTRENAWMSSGNEDEGLVYKSTGKLAGKWGTVEEIWVERDTSESLSEDKNIGLRQYVRDPKNPNKVHCQNMKDIDKLIDDKNLQCLKCKMQYTSISNLRRHVIRHLGWKRYKCKICMYTFYDRSECRLHYVRKHGNHLDRKNFTQYYIDLKHLHCIDLKHEASRIRNEKRVNTLRSNKESGKIPEQDMYKRPRQTVLVKTSTHLANTDSIEPQDISNGPNASGLDSPRRKSKNSPAKKGEVEQRIHDSRQKNRGSSDEKTVQNSLLKARQNLAKVLHDSKS